MADRLHFKSLMLKLGLVYDREVTAELAAVYFEDLGHFTNEELDEMVRSHRRDTECGQFFPKPANLLAKAKKAHQHPVADLAWATAIKSFDEKDTIAWTQEIAGARQAALPVWNSGDKVGARHAFKAAYEAILARLPPESVPKWQLSGGHDPRLRHDAVQRALEMGMISKSQADGLLPHYLNPMPRDVKTAVAGLIEHNQSGMQRVANGSPGQHASVTELSTRSEFVRKFHETIEAARAATVIEEQAHKENQEREAKQKAMDRRSLLDSAEYMLARKQQESLEAQAYAALESHPGKDRAVNS